MNRKAFVAAMDKCDSIKRRQVLGLLSTANSLDSNAEGHRIAERKRMIPEGHADALVRKAAELRQQAFAMLGLVAQ